MISEQVAAHCVDTIDYLVQTAARAGTQVQRAQNRASTVTVTGTDILRATEIRKCVTLLRKNQARYRMGSHFVGVLHPNVIHDLREEGPASAGGVWRTPNEYGVDQSQIWNGEFGEFEGVRFISTPTLFRPTDNDGAASANVFRGFIMGKEALGKSVIKEPGVVLGPQTDLLRRFAAVGWYADLDYKVYRNATLVRLESASSLAP
ncbi:MAG: N4-gp56 family major capsid protein [Dermatophilaceae bacterium]